MPKSVVETYPQLWHYTTARGLQGILASQQLWATNIYYLNDAEEFTGFFDRKLPHLLKVAAREGIAEACKTAEGLSSIGAAGGQEKVENDVSTHLLAGLRTATLNLQAFVTSFCYTPSGLGEDGLLSQWRGYGADGGYAIVFDTQGLNELMQDERRRFNYAFSHWGDVDYYDDDAGAGAAHEETLEWEGAIRKTIASVIVERNLLIAAEALCEPVLSLATRHKHCGFREESEVRIVVVTPNDEMISEARKAGENQPNKPVHFTRRGGVLVPHIALFERPDGGAATLPIRKIIVGPHPEKIKRKKSVEMMLDQLEIEAKVVTSDIPYLGR